MPAARNHRDAEGLGEFDGGLDIQAGHHAVATDVGVDDGFDAVVLEFLGEIDHVVASHFRPAVHRHLAVLGIQTDDDMAREGIAGFVQKAGRLHGCGADDHVADAVVDVALDRIEIADAPAELDGNARRRPGPRIALIASSFLGLPAKAPFRSTRCRRRAPWSSQCWPSLPGLRKRRWPGPSRLASGVRSGRL
jgi:hypothetical protein